MLTLFLFFAAFAIPLFALFHFIAKRQREMQYAKVNRLRKNSPIIEADFKGVEKRNPRKSLPAFRIHCQSIDEHSNKRDFYSEWLTSDPTPFMAPYKKFLVRIDPHDPTVYVVEIPAELARFL